MIAALLRPVGFLMLAVIVGIVGVVVGNLNGGNFAYGLLGILCALVVVAVADIIVERARR